MCAWMYVCVYVCVCILCLGRRCLGSTQHQSTLTGVPPPHATCDVTTTPHFTNERHSDTSNIWKCYLCNGSHSATEHWSCAVYHRTSPWYLLNVGWCSPSISLVYVKFHSDLQYVRNHRNRLAFVSRAGESVFWAELSNTAVADDWPTRTFSVGEKKLVKKKITLIKGVTFWRAEDDFPFTLLCDKLSLCTSQNPELWCFGGWKTTFWEKKKKEAFFERVRWEEWCNSYPSYIWICDILFVGCAQKPMA